MKNTEEVSNYFFEELTDNLDIMKSAHALGCRTSRPIDAYWSHMDIYKGKNIHDSIPSINGHSKLTTLLNFFCCKWLHLISHNSAISWQKLKIYRPFLNYRRRSFRWVQPDFCSFSRLKMTVHQSWLTSPKIVLSQGSFWSIKTGLFFDKN